MANMVRCTRCDGQGKIDIEAHAPAAAGVLKILREHGPLTANLIQEYSKGAHSLSSVYYNLGWLIKQDLVVRTWSEGVGWYQVVED